MHSNICSNEIIKKILLKFLFQLRILAFDVYGSAINLKKKVYNLKWSKLKFWKYFLLDYKFNEMRNIAFAPNLLVLNLCNAIMDIVIHTNILTWGFT